MYCYLEIDICFQNATMWHVCHFCGHFPIYDELHIFKIKISMYLFMSGEDLLKLRN